MLYPIEISYLFDYRNEVNGNDIFWSSIDCLMILSKADNSPNVIHEAKINGIPIIGSNVGGISELLNSKYDFLIDLNSDIEFQRTKSNDIIKNKYCHEKNIKLLRIPYNQFKNIENIVKENIDPKQ
jgi:glycosyltransferase involved in cell wall biosynthesis